MEVPEWSVVGKPSVIYYKPSLNFSQQEKILALSDPGKKAEAIVEALIQRALDEDGNRLFKTVDRTELMKHTDPEIISRIVGAMSGMMMTWTTQQKTRTPSETYFLFQLAGISKS